MIRPTSALEPVTFGQLVKQRRTELDLTQDALAKEVMCAIQTIRALETGQRRASRELTERLAIALRIPPEQRPMFLRLARRVPQGSGSEIAQPTFPSRLAPIAPASEAPSPQLPTTPNNFVGREQERVLLLDTLGDPSCRLLNLIGPGGVGKSRLALQVALELAPRFVDGVAWAALASVPAPEQVAPAIASALGCSLHGSSSAEELLAAFLQDRELLLVLDNFEHLQDARDLPTTLLRQAPRIRLIVTSRDRLHLRDEHVVEIQGLSLPQDNAPASVGQSEAVMLFVERARQVEHDFALTPDNATAVAQICRLLAGLPLGIELAASWVRSLTPPEIAQEIARSLDFLVLAGRDSTPRHRSLRAVFDHSWRLLSPTERAIVARLAVFRGGFSREAARQVADADMSILGTLVDKSLIRHSIDATAGSRYDLHEVVRQYAEEKLEEAGELAQTRTRHLAYFLQWTEVAEPHLIGPDLPLWVSAFEAEQGNLRQALGWVVESQQPESGWRLAAALVRFWYLSGAWTEGRDWLQRVLAAEASTPSHGYARALAGAAFLARWQGDYGQATELSQTSIRMFEALGSWLGAARCELTMAGIALLQQEVERAQHLSEKSLRTFREHGDLWGLSEALHALGTVVLAQGDTARALALYEEGLRHARALQDRGAIAVALNNLGLVVRTLGDTARARVLFDEALELCQVVRTRQGISWTLHNLGMIALDEGDYQQAVADFADSLQIRWELRDHSGLAWTVEGMADAAAGQGQFDRAVQLLGAVAVMRQMTGASRTPAEQSASDERVARLRQHLPGDRFEAAWAAGQAMSMEQVVTFARGGVR